MIKVVTETEIMAPVELCFDLARNIEIHTRTVWKHTREEAVGGITEGLINEGESVTFQATHFGIRQKLSSRVTEFSRPHRFVDVMTRGAFKSMRHEHAFMDLGDRTLMKDTLCFEAPLGILGRVVERIILQHYMRRFLQHRNARLKELTERMMQH